MASLIRITEFAGPLPGNAGRPGSWDMSWSTGDFIGDGTVDVNDLTILLSNFGETAGSSAAGMAAVAEPSTIALLLAGAACLLGYAWRRRCLTFGCAWPATPLSAFLRALPRRTDCQSVYLRGVAHVASLPALPRLLAGGMLDMALLPRDWWNPATPCVAVALPCARTFRPERHRHEHSLRYLLRARAGRRRRCFALRGRQHRSAGRRAIHRRGRPELSHP